MLPRVTQQQLSRQIFQDGARNMGHRYHYKSERVTTVFLDCLVQGKEKLRCQAI